jgi:hypothetical protein
MLGLPVRLLDESTLTDAASSKTFTLSDYTIPSGSRHLVILCDAQVDTGGQNAMAIRFNGDTGSNYNTQDLTGDGSTVAASRRTGQTSARIWNLIDTANKFGGGYVVIPHYAGTVGHKAFLAFGGPAESKVHAIAGRWANTAAITSVTLVMESNQITATSYIAIGVVDERYAIGESILSGSDGTFSFPTIPALQGDLVAVGYLRSDRADVDDTVRIALNADTTDANYSRQLLRGTGTSALAAASSDRIVGHSVTGNSATSGAFGALVAQISQHNRGVNDPHIVGMTGFHETSTPFASVGMTTGRRNNVAAVTAVAFDPTTGTNFKDGSMMSLYYVPKELIYRYVESGGGSSSQTTPTIPSGYASIEVCVYGQTDWGSANDGIHVSLNADETDGNYGAQRLTGVSTTVAAASFNRRDKNWIPGTGANIFGGGWITLPRYDQTDRHKFILSLMGSPDGAIGLVAARWKNTAAVTSIKFSPENGTNFIDGTVIEVWGVVDKDNEPDLQGTRATKAVVTPS